MTIAWRPGQPNVPMRRVAGFEQATQPGDFWFQTRVTISEYRTVEPHEGVRPSDIWFKDNRGRFHRVSINPEKMSNGAGWDWDGDWEKPTLSPSILSSFDKDNQRVVLWHGYVRGGVVGFEC